MIVSDNLITKLWRTFHDLENMVEQIETIAKSRLPEWLAIWGRASDANYSVWVGDFAELVKDQKIKVILLGDRNNDDFLWMPLDFLRQGGAEREIQRRARLLSSPEASLDTPALIDWMKELMTANFSEAMRMMGELVCQKNADTRTKEEELPLLENIPGEEIKEGSAPDMSNGDIDPETLNNS